MEHWAKLFFGKIAPKHVQSKFGQFWERFWAFLDFWNFSKTRPSMEHRGKFFFEKKCPKTRLNTWERFWTISELWIFFAFFLEFFLSIYLKFSVRKIEFNFFKSRKLNSYFWVRESELIILSRESLKWGCVYWQWRECKENVCWVLFRKTELLILSPENWTHIFNNGNLNT